VSILDAISNPDRIKILVILEKEPNGVSYSTLHKDLKLNHKSLTEHLKKLVSATLVWNNFEKREGRAYSYYKLSTLGRGIIEEGLKFNIPKHEDELIAVYTPRRA
jgi:predicted transcriptional regulator